MNHSPFELFKSAKPIKPLSTATTNRGMDFTEESRQARRLSKEFVEGYNQGKAACTQLLTLNEETVSLYYMRKQLIKRIEAITEQLQPLFELRRKIEKEQDKLALKGFVSESRTHRADEYHNLTTSISKKNERINELKNILLVEVEAIEVNQV